MSKLVRLLVFLALAGQALLLSSPALAAEPYVRGRIAAKVNRIFGALDESPIDIGYPLNSEKPVVIVESDPAGVVATIVGPAGTDHRTFGERLDRWAAQEELTLRRRHRDYDEDSPIVSATIGAAPPVTLAHGGIPNLQKLAQVAGSPDCLLWVSNRLRLTGAPSPDVEEAEGRFWMQNEESGWWRPEKADGSNPESLAAIYFLLLSLPILGLLATWLIATLQAKKHGPKTLAGRRAYSNAVMNGLLYLTCLPFLAVGVLLAAGFFQDLALWIFREKIALPFLLFPVVVLFAAAVSWLVLMLNKKVFGPNEEELLHGNRTAPRSPLVSAAKGLPAASITLPVLILALAGTILVYVYTHDIKILIAGLLAVPLASIAARSRQEFLARKAAANPEHAQVLGGLNDLLGQERFLVKGKPLEGALLTSAHIPRHYAVATGKAVAFTPEFLEEASPAALEFVTAHELGHIVLGHIPHRRAFLIVFLLSLLLPMIFFLPRSPSVDALTVGMIFPFHACAVCLCALAYVRWAYVRQEFEADAWAIGRLGTDEGAIEALTILSKGSKIPGLHEVNLYPTHPPIQDRLKRIAAYAAALRAEPSTS